MHNQTLLLQYKSIVGKIENAEMGSININPINSYKAFVKT